MRLRAVAVPEFKIILQTCLLCKFVLPPRRSTIDTDSRHSPLKAKVAVRDHWSKADGALQTSLKGLKELLGLNVTVEPEWQLLITELDTFYEDNANLVTIVAGCVQTWVKCIVEVLDDPAREEWTATLLDKVWANHLPLYIEVYNEPFF
jgi:hypothetical protein